MKSICGLLMLLGSFSVYASEIGMDEILSPQKFALTQNTYERTTLSSDLKHIVANKTGTNNIIYFSGRVTEGTCVNTAHVNTALTTQCGVSPPIRTEKSYSFGSVVTLTYL